eukprot:CAMPEP_0197451288 /NCGR_PEP_ID=MMETSP1175-20131217/28337_1 /TAXON_ID=1003142 /ORGANISM="Triceratium dubium, Strain CCMP147" /LENGTH=343 /DNA_ID=CAMNT_0042983945 /DNA_START=25 /DNA_END=1056 /DNA_ORIENTATION=+
MTMSQTRHSEHESGLILHTLDESKDDSVVQSSPPDTRILSPHLVESLKALRDANPSLLRKLNHGVTVDATPDESIGYWNRIQDVVILSEAENKEESRSLKGLNVGGLMVRIVDCVPFFLSLQEYDISLQMINFGGTDISTTNLLQGMKKIQMSSQTISTLEELYLGGCGIASRKGVQDLLEVLQLPLCSRIKKLDLRYNDMSGLDIKTLEPVLLSEESKIEILHLEGNMLRCDGAKSIASMLAKTKSLKEIYLGANGIGVEGATFLAEGLKNNASLEKLYLEGNSIGSEGADAFRVVLLDQTERKCKFLKHLYVDNNGMGKDAAMKLGRALNSENLIPGSLFD